MTNIATESAIPAWLRDADQEERAELVALGVLDADESLARYDDPSITDAVVSRVLRARHALERDVERYDAAEAGEHAWITARYDRLRAPAEGQLQRLAGWLLSVAEAMTFTGKAKSRSVGWGKIGRRLGREKVEISDEQAAIAYLQVKKPEVVDVTITIPYTLYVAVTTAIDPTSNVGKELQGWLEKPKLSLSKSDASDAMKLLKVKEIPGAKLIDAEDRPFFEVEPPPDFGHKEAV